MTDAFASAAHALRAVGLAVIPVGGADGKLPLVTWGRWRRPPGRAFVDKLLAKYPGANVGVLCGLSQVTIIDVDHAALVDPMTRRCGTTPLVTRTPRGGAHLWYRSSGERSADLRHEGLAVDVKANGGFVVVPPSSAPNGAAYSFAFGSWADLPRLPVVKPGSLPAAEGCENRTLSLRAVGPDHRNVTLFQALLRQAGACDAESDLLDVAETIVADHFQLDARHPFTPAEIAKTVASVWRYDQTGRNWAGKEARAMTTAAELAVLQRNPDALTLRLILQCAHGARPEPFAIAARALAAGEFIDGWSDRKRYAAARDWLVAHGFLEQTHVGGRGPRDPHLYRLKTPDQVAAAKGPPTGPNIIEHPPPLASGPDGRPLVVGAGKRASR